MSGKNFKPTDPRGALEAKHCQPPAHLRRPLPLVVDVAFGLCQRAGWAPPENAHTLSLNRGVLELIRLQHRFRGVLYLASPWPQDWSLWLAEIVGGGRTIACENPEPAARAARVLHLLEPRGFDYVGDAAGCAAVGAAARRVWVIGAASALRHRLMTHGTGLIELSAQDWCDARQLRPVQAAAGWEERLDFAEHDASEAPTTQINTGS